MGAGGQIAIGLTGSFGSGCTTLRETLAEKEFTTFSLSKIIHEKWREMNPGKPGEEATRRELQGIGNNLRKEKGNAFLMENAIREGSFEKKNEGPSFDIQCLSLNFKFNDILAAVLLPQLDIHCFNHIIERRNSIAEKYKCLLGDMDVELIWPLGNDRPSWLFLPVLLPKSFASFRSQVVNVMRESGVEVGIHYPIVCELQFINDKPYKYTKHPVAKDFSSRVLTLPCHEGLDQSDVKIVVETMQAVLAEMSI